MAALAPYYTCLGVVADDAPMPELPAGVRAIYLSEYRQLSDSVREERHLFQIGNNAGHAYILPWIERVSGVVVIHDATLAHVLDWIAAKSGGPSAYRDLADAAHGPLAKEVLVQSSLNGLWFGAMGQEITFLPPVIRPSRAIIVHSRLARQRVLAADASACVHVIPHFAHVGKDRLADRSEESRTEYRILCLGFPSRAKRLDLVLDALRIILNTGIEARLIIAGEIRPEEVDLESEIRARDLGGAVELKGYVPENLISDLIDNADVLVNLRDPTSGESSGTLARALGAGLCTMVTDVGTYSEFPDGTVYKLRKAEMTASGLAQALWRLWHDPALRAAIAAGGQAYVFRHCSIEGVAQQYRDVIEAAYARLGKSLNAEAVLAFPTAVSRIKFEQLAKSHRALASPFQLWWRERLLPVTRNGAVLVCLDVSDALRTMIKEGWGWESSSATDGVAPTFYAGLALFDETCVERLREWQDQLVAIASNLPPCGALIIEIINEKYLRGALTRSLAAFGLRCLRETYGPTLPLLTEENQSWLPTGWCACFVKSAMPVVSAVDNI
jgi:glycosyltransferase involved in cell wall biosynthesis